MRKPYLQPQLCLLAPLLLPVVSAIALSDFAPRNQGLSRNCDAVYRAQIPTCAATDFEGGRCSNPCANGLAAVQSQIQRNCQSDVVSETSLVGLFLIGSGIRVLCPNFQVETAVPAPAPAPTSVAPAPPPATSAPPPPPATSTPPPPATSDAVTSTVSSETPQSTDDDAAATSAVVDTTPTTQPPQETSPPPFVVPVDSSTSLTTDVPQVTQLSNSDSGGGSPFDVQGAALPVNAPAAILGMFSMVAAFFVVF